MRWQPHFTIVWGIEVLDTSTPIMMVTYNRPPGPYTVHIVIVVNWNAKKKQKKHDIYFTLSIGLVTSKFLSHL